MRITLAITGASGTVYGIRLAKALKQEGVELDVIVSNAAKKVFDYEDEGGSAGVMKELGACGKVYSEDEIEARPASGSSCAEAMIVCPCSMKTLSAIANGYDYNLVARAADVCLKEGKQLVLVPREMPFSAIQLENMLKLARLGVVIMPPQPAFYNKPKTLADAVDFVVGKVLKRVGIESKLLKEWRP